MPRPSRKTPTKIARVKAARAAGKGLRAAAQEAGVSHETVRNWERRSGGRARARAGARASEQRDTASAELAGAGAAAVVDGAPLPEGIDDLRARLAMVRAQLARLAPAVERDEYSATSYVTLARYADDLATRIAELTPPAPKDPADNEDLGEAERILLARIENMVAEAEGRAAR